MPGFRVSDFKQDFCKYWHVNAARLSSKIPDMVTWNLMFEPYLTYYKVKMFALIVSKYASKKIKEERDMKCLFKRIISYRKIKS